MACLAVCGASVCPQIFNEFNARSITNSWNIVKGLKNPMFLGVIVFTVLTQFLIVQEGGSFTRSVFPGFVPPGSHPVCQEAALVTKLVVNWK